MSTLTPLSSPGFTAKGKFTVAHAIAACLQRHGIRYVFGQSLPSLLHLACEELGLQQIAYRTENAGGYMADGYARITGTPTIVTAQNGPAATLLVAPLAEALKASIPVIALVQEVNRDQADRNAFQEFDHEKLFASCAKWIRKVTVASRIEDYVDQAFAAACSGRPGPAVLLLPADLLAEVALEPARRLNLGRYPLDRMCADISQIQLAAQWIVQAEHPVVIAGGGVHGSQAWEALSALQECAHLPVATTVMGKGAINESHPLSAGMVANSLGPNSLTRSQRELVSGADLVLLVGNRTNQNGTDSWTLYPRDARYIHIDVDGLEVGRNYESLRLVGDAKLTLEALVQALGQEDLSKRAQARDEVEQRISAAKKLDLESSASVRLSDARPIRPERIMHELQQRLGPTDVVVADASYSSIWITNFLTAQRAGMRFITPRGLAGLGWGFPMALGAKAAKPDAEVYCVVGDGGFGHVWSELETAVRMNLKVTLIVINNGILGFQKHAENLKYGAHTSAVDFAPVDHAAVARACGCVGIRVEDPAEIGAALEQARAAKTTALIEVLCDQNAFPPLTFYTPQEA